MDGETLPSNIFSKESVVFQKNLVALQTRFLIGGEALNPDKTDVTTISKGLLTDLQSRDYQAFDNASLNERRQTALVEKDKFNTALTSWAQETASKVLRNTKHHETISKIFGFDAKSVTQKEFIALYQKYFSKKSNVKLFVNDVLRAYGNDFNSLEKNLSSIQWVANIFGSTSAEMVAQLVDAERKLQTQPDKLVEEANKGNRLNNLLPKEKELLEFVWKGNILPEKKGNELAESFLAEPLTYKNAFAVHNLEKGLLKDQEEHVKQGINQNHRLAVEIAHSFSYGWSLQNDIYNRIVHDYGDVTQDLNQEFSSIHSKYMDADDVATKSLGFDNRLDGDGSFIHCYSKEQKKQKLPTKYRIYLNPLPKYFPNIIKELFVYGENKPLYFKMLNLTSNDDFARVDKAILYLSDKNVDETIRFLLKLNQDHPEYFSGRAVQGGSKAKIVDGIGLSPELRTAKGEKTSGGTIAAERISSALEKKLVDRLTSITTKFSNEDDYVRSEDYRVATLALSKNLRKIDDQVLNISEVKEAYSEALLLAYFRSRTKLTLDTTNNKVIELDEALVNKLFLERLQLKDQNNAYQIIMRMPSLKKSIHYWPSINQPGIFHSGLALLFNDLLSQGKKPADIFRENNIL